MEVRDLGARRPAREEARPDGVAAQLVEQQPARRDPGQLIRRSAARYAGTLPREVVVDEGEPAARPRVELDRWSTSRSEHDADGVAVADRLRERVDRALPDHPGGSAQTTPGPEPPSSWPTVSDASIVGLAAPGPLQS